MLNKFIAITAAITIGLAGLGALEAGEPSLKDQIIAIDKELLGLRQTTLSDPEVKAAQAELQAAMAKLKATEDAVLVRTNPKGKELVEKFRKLLEQYNAQQKTESSTVPPKKP